MRRLLHDESGMTLVELSIAGALLVIVMAGLSNMFVSGLRASSTGDAQLASQGAVRTAFDRLEYEARCADTATLLSAGAGVYLHLPSQCPNATGDVSWCVSGGSLDRIVGTSCAASGEALVSDVTSPTPFCVQTVTGDQPQLYVSLTVDASTTSADSSSATDVITLRNAQDATSTSAACP